MKFPKSSAINACASTDPARPVLNHVFLENGKLIATDGNVLACVPVEVGPDDTDGLVSVEAIKTARKLAKNGLPATITCRDNLHFSDGTTMARPNGNYPDWKIVTDTGKAQFKIALDIEELTRLASALSDGKSSTIVLSFKDELSAIKVEGTIKGAFGVMLPRRFP